MKFSLSDIEEGILKCNLNERFRENDKRAQILLNKKDIRIFSSISLYDRNSPIILIIPRFNTERYL